MSWKLCTGRGMTNATPRFNMDIPGADYAADNRKTKDINMYGFIFVPYDNGQYSVSTNWARAEHLIGFQMADMMNYQYATMGVDYNTPITVYVDPTGATPGYSSTSAGTQTHAVNTMTYLDQTTPVMSQVPTTIAASAPEAAKILIPSASMAKAPTFKDFGNIDLFTAMFKAEGVGSEINSFLDDTKFFASWAQSKTNPTNGMAMLGSTSSETGSSVWLGANMPCPITEDGRFGVEWNKGSKYWRSVTYGEDTMTGSKIAARGTALEAYYMKPINKALSFNIRYTKIDYDYTGSNSFFGEDGTPMTMAEAKAGGQDPVEKATDLRASISYRF
jgi:hypothetical protein